MMRDFMSEDDVDIERLIAMIGEPPAAPMKVVRQQLERENSTEHPGLLLRLFGVFSPKTGQ
ncbi:MULTISPECIES: hypothetical protein [unclassified Yoonia]|uniref:hypothetical protein n=1 Tax=unclassified Yoonia TaxID=2629118 RepID=UPI002AFFBDAF|nr:MULTISPECIES: hypothetical protein [unclassified Yoonia]